MEIWKDIDGYDGQYKISNFGRVKSLLKWDVNKRAFVVCEKIMKPFNNNNGYLEVSLLKNKKRKNHFIHRLVANAFIPKINGKNIVNHKDFNSLNNNIDNLEWVTQRENVLYSIENMKHRKSITHSNTKEKYITYRAKKKVYRVIIDRKERGTFKTLEEAIKKRNSILEKGSDAK